MARQIATQQKHVPAKTTKAQVELVEDISPEEAGTGIGLSKDQADNLTPIVKILQALSPQCVKRSPDYLPDAEPGDIFLRGAPDPLVKADEGILFQPCKFFKEWLEWIPRDAGGGLVNRFRDEDLEKMVQAGELERTSDKFLVHYHRTEKPDETEFVETRYFAGYVIKDGDFLPYVVTFSSTGHKVARAWMTLMNQLGGDIWAYAYRLTTRPESNAMGEWFNFDIKKAGAFKNPEDRDRGRKLYQAFTTGERIVEHEQQERPDEQAL